MTTRPNIVLILADDLGWTDLSGGRTCLGRGSDYYRTPNIDALAAAGVAFDNAYTTGPNCLPTRAALWSGRCAARTGCYTVPPSNRGQEQARQLDAAPTNSALAASYVTIAEAVRAAGYVTAYFGKWHLGDDPTLGPVAQGFASNAGGSWAGSVASHFANAAGGWPLPGLPANGVAGQFLADRLTDEAVAFLGQPRAEPFFAAVSHFSPHVPVQAPAADIAAFDGVPKGVRHRDQVYAAMLKNLDDNVGRVVAALESTDDPRNPGHKLIENTVVVFLSDNGGVGGYDGVAPDITHQYPLRGGKGMLYEGGIRVPLIVRWDGVVTAGRVESEPVTSLDLYPTLAGIAGATLRTVPLELDGDDIRMMLLGGAIAPRSLFWHFPCYLEADAAAGTWRTTPVSVVRNDNWKLLFFHETRRIELYDLAADLGETTNVAGSNFGLASSLCTALRDWLRDTGAALPRIKGTATEVPYPAAFTTTETPMGVR